ncbi:MAG: hypothetical protein KIT14_07565 [bacterium]|nr:hypothetical protein [bacterium]
MSAASHTPSPGGRDDVVATPDGVLEALRRVEIRIARLGDDGGRLATLIAGVGERLLAVATAVEAAGPAGDPRADELRRRVTAAAAAARALAADALRALERTAAVLHAQHDAFGSRRPPDPQH